MKSFANSKPLLALGLLPILVVLLSGPPFYNPFVSIDPWLYTGYFNNLKELNQNFGWNNYYISRMPWIILGYLAYKLPVLIGYWVLHISLYYATGAFFYLFLKERYGISAAVVGFALLAANPLLLIADIWEYPAGAAIMYLVAGLYFLVRAFGARASSWSTLPAGIFLAAAAYCHLGIAPYVAAYVSIQILFMVRQDWRRAARLAGGLLAGLTSCTVILGAVSFAWLGHFLFFEPQVVAAFLANADMVNKKAGSFAWMATYYRVFVPMILIVAALAAWARSWPELEDEAQQYRRKILADGLFLALPYSFFLLLEVFSSGIYLQVSYWFVFQLPGICLLAAALAGRYIAPVWKGYNSLFVVLLVALGPAWIVASPRLIIVFSTHPAVLVVLALIMFGVLLWRLKTPALVLPCVMILFVNGSFALTPDVYSFFADHLGKTTVNESTLLGGIRLVQELHKYNLRDADFLFWARREGPYGGCEFVSMAAMYLNRFVNTEMPRLDSSALRLIHSAEIRKIIALSRKDKELDDAVQALDASGLHPRIIGGNRITQGELSFAYRVIAIPVLPDEIPENLEEIPNAVQLSALKPAPVTSIKRDPVRMTATAVQPWAYLATVPIAFPNGSEQARIRVIATVLKGDVGFGVLNDKGTAFYDRKFSRPGEVDFLLEVAHPEDTHTLVVCNGGRPGETDIVVHKISALAQHLVKERKADSNLERQ